MSGIDAIIAQVAALSVADKTAADVIVTKLISADESVRTGAVAELSAVTSLVAGAVFTSLKSKAEEKDIDTRVGFVNAVCSIATGNVRVFEPYYALLLSSVLDLLCDKKPAPKKAAEAALATFVGGVPQNATRYLMPTILEYCTAYKWQSKTGALQAIKMLATSAPDQLARCLPDLTPKLTEALADTKPSVVTATIDAVEAAISVIGNRDIAPFAPVLVACTANPAEVPECVFKLAATTFVQSVTAPTLSIMVPMLERALREGSTAVKRKAMKIIDNMSKLVDDPTDAHVFLPRLLPGLKRCADEVADPECREVAGQVVDTLVKIGGSGEDAEAFEKAVQERDAKGVAAVKAALGDNANATLTNYVSALCMSLASIKCAETDLWDAAVSIFINGGSAQVMELNKVFSSAAVAEEEDPDDEEGEDLCNCEFSLAYGSKILLNNAKMRLKRGHRYGLVGDNGCGKTTLMRAIANGQVDGFPPADQLRTVYVETDIPAEHAELLAIDYVKTDAMLQDTSVKDINDMLLSVGFTQAMIESPVSTFSGGWRMKVALARAMLKNADILLLDEPTNHLDVNNVAWVENYLISLTNVTSIIVSHDSSCLDKVCTDMIHMDLLKIKRFRGNLTAFVKVFPKAKAYFELKSAVMKFTFPEPGFLEGVKSRGRAVMKMRGVGFTYPGTTRKILHGVSINCSMASRCAVVGPNGAGKSTMIKLLTGELEADTGECYRHPNLVIAYVAQHAFHHLEQHMEKTPNEYIRWRYQFGEDKESLAKVTMVVTEAEQALMDKVWVIDGEKRAVERICGRVAAKKGFKYEVKWKGQSNDKNSWMSREKLEEMGWEKELKRTDDKAVASAQGYKRTLSATTVEKHISDLGLEAEFATHCRINALSTSQKVKVVLAAALWANPHIIILDEPTNYLDREALGALAEAIREFKGGVVMISHHTEFTEALCPETWSMKDGFLTPYGESACTDDVKLEETQKTEMTDAFGNVIKVKAKKKKMSRKELMAYKRRREAAKREGMEVSDTDSDLD
jgi:elongation factor 3